MLGPILLIAIYALFLGIMRFPMSMPVLVTGIFCWQFLAMCLGDSTNAVIGNANLVKKSAFPRIMLPLSMVLANLVNFLLSMVVVLVYLLIFGPPFGNPVWLLLALPAHLLLCAGVSMMLSALNVFFRDVQHLIGMVSMAWFFMTPVIYDASEISRLSSHPLIQTLFYANPMTGILSLYRAALLGAAVPDAGAWGLSLAVAAAVFVAGLAVFQKTQWRFADEL